MAIQGRFLSIEHISSRALATLRRFPFTLCCALVGTITGIYLIELDGVQFPEVGLRLLFSCALGLPLFTALTLLAERSSWSAATKRLFPAVGLLLLAAYYFSLPDRVTGPLIHPLRFLLLALGAHFMVAFLPFLGRDDREGFWQYNRALFLRILLANIYFNVLFAGLALALVAADQLFGLDVQPRTYPQLGVLLVGLFQTWIFLAGIPERLDDLNRSTEYPPGLKVFTQFILLPLVILYFVILITYEGKILVTGDWPQGWVAHLVLWYSVASILSLLLLHPLQTQAGNRWITTFGTWFFRGLVPLLVMLYIAIYQRIAEYGVTVNRFLVVNMAVGLTLVVLYFVLGRKRDIRFIPIVLFILCLLSAYGPFSAFAVAERSQRTRLTEYLTRNGLLVEGKISAAASVPSEEDQREMSSIMSYLWEFHGPDAFRDWVEPARLARLATDSVPEWRDTLSASLGFTYQSSWRMEGDRMHFYFTSDEARRAPLTLSGWTYLVDYTWGGAHDSVRAYVLGADSCFVTFDTSSLQITLSTGADRATAVPAATLPLAERIVELRASAGESPCDPARMTFSGDPAGRPSEWHFDQISGSIEDGESQVTYLRARILVGPGGT